MKLTTKGRYGLRAMFDLALNYSAEPVSLNTIANRQGISVNYLEQLISPLRKAGLVKSIRGAQGGYMLARNPKQISVGEILETLEGPLAPATCVVETDDSDACSCSEYCVTKIIYEKIRDSINDVVNGISLQDMIDDHKKINSNNIILKCE